MASAEKMREKLLALEAKLELYGYVPSQKEDRAVYANAKYYSLITLIIQLSQD